MTGHLKAPFLFLLTALVLTAAWPGPMRAQNIFAPVAQVNDGAVTGFEVEQRMRLMDVLGQPGASRGNATDLLIDDRLKQQAAKAADIEATYDDVQLGIEEFAARANLTGEELLQALSDAGIAEETVRDYVGVNLAWGEVVRSRYAGRARPSEAEIDRALALGTGGGSARVLVSEIVLPLTPEMAAQTEELAPRIAAITTTAEFEEAARRFSVAPSRSRGGRLDWLALSDLPPQLGPLLLTLSPGQVSDPVPLQGAVAFFQLRAIQDVLPQQTGNVTLDYVQMRFPAGTNLAQEEADLRANADQCIDLFGYYKGAPESQLSRHSGPRASLPQSVTSRLAALDPGEITAIGPQGSGDGGSLVMLCSRIEIVEEDVDRADIARRLFERRLNTLADGYLAELRADAYIVKR